MSVDNDSTTFSSPHQVRNMDKLNDNAAASAGHKVEASHSLLNDAYDFGAHLMSQARTGADKHPHLAMAVLAVGVVAGHGKGAGALEGAAVAEGRAAAGLLGDLVSGESRVAVAAESRPLAEGAARAVADRAAEPTGSERLLDALKSARNEGETLTALQTHGNFERTYAGYRAFFGP
jgi:hypothetical protein